MQQEILAAYPDAGLRVYAVWFSTLPGDSRDRFPADLLPDSRVTQFWDQDHLVGTAFAALVDWNKGALWDAFFLYGPDAHWPESAGAGLVPAQAGRPQGSPLQPPRPASWGRTIFSARDQLKMAFLKMR